MEHQHEQLTVTHWRRYGKDRLYVNDGAGTRVGWVDLATGVRHLEVPELEAEFARAVDANPQELGQSEVEASVLADDQPIEVLPAVKPARLEVAGEAQPWEDLASRRPGQAAREKALEELVASKERSRFWSFVARAVDAKTDERAWRVGADGEETVGGRLEKLRQHGWHILHAVPVGERGSDIDHVLVGPGGVYTLNTKNHPGKKVWVSKNSVRVNGYQVPYLRNSRHEADRASKLLSAAAGFDVPVRPVLVLLTGTLIPDVTIKTAPEDVLILDRIDIPRVFKRAPLRMDPMVVDTIYDAARRSTTWSSLPPSG